MKALTLTPPWGTLVAIGAKRIETRAWSTNYRGPIAIHQAKLLNGLRLPNEPRVGTRELERRLAELCDRDPFFAVLRPHLSGYTAAERASCLPRGRIVAVADLTEVLSTTDFTFMQPVAALYEQDFGDFSNGRFAWLLERVTPLYGTGGDAGIECAGGRGLWDVPTHVLEEIDSLVGEEDAA